jgi:mannan endo-1,4-beta-mannosidase
VILPEVYGQSKFKTLNYLYQISGRYTLAGQHNREPNAEPCMWTDSIHSTTGKFPALWSGDFLFQQENMDQRWAMIREAERQWNTGSMVQIMLHTCPPSGEPCEWNGGVLSKLSDEAWKEIFINGSPMNRLWKIRLDTIGRYLLYLKEKNVEVLFRPHHEMNQGVFWWGGRKGPEGTAKLYRFTHDYLIDSLGLDNLIWVWDVQDMSRDIAEYNPGGDYWDVFAFDVYDQGYNREWYEYLLPIAGNKPMAIGECARLPTAEMLAEQPRWVFFMSWAELVYKENSQDEIIRLYNSERIITREEMGDWKE